MRCRWTCRRHPRAPQAPQNGRPTTPQRSPDVAERGCYNRFVTEFRILGPLEVVGPQGPLPLSGPKQRALLGLLLIHAGEVLSTDQIVDVLWDGNPPKTATTSLWNLITQLRKVLPADGLVTTPPGCGSAYAASRCSRSTALAGRPRRCRRTSTPAGRSSTSSGSSRARPCSACTARSCARRLAWNAHPHLRWQTTTWRTSSPRC